MIYSFSVATNWNHSEQSILPPFGTVARSNDRDPSIGSLSAGFFQSCSELLGGRPGPIWLCIRRHIEDLLVLFPFGCCPRFDEQDERCASNSVVELKTMSGQPVTCGFPLFASPSGEKLELTFGQFHGN